MPKWTRSAPSMATRRPEPRSCRAPIGLSRASPPAHLQIRQGLLSLDAPRLGAILPCPTARVGLMDPRPPRRRAENHNAMIKRLLIAGLLVALFLGGAGYFNLVFKPKMIGEFMAKMVPPPATVTAERAGTQSWVDRVQSIGT